MTTVRLGFYNGCTWGLFAEVRGFTKHFKVFGESEDFDADYSFNVVLRKIYIKQDLACEKVLQIANDVIRKLKLDGVKCHFRLGSLFTILKHMLNHPDIANIYCECFKKGKKYIRGMDKDYLMFIFGYEATTDRCKADKDIILQDLNIYVPMFVKCYNSLVIDDHLAM